MKAAEQALNESRDDEAAQCCTSPFTYAEKFKPGDQRLDQTVDALATLLYMRGNYTEAERAYLEK